MLFLRPAGPSDIADLERWDQEPAVIAAGAAETDDWAAEIAGQCEWYEILIAEVDGRPIGVVQIIDPALEATHYWGVDVEPDLRALDIWIGEPEMRRRGHGARMMELALDRCFSAPGVTAVLIDPLVANVDAQRFYRRLGFVDVGPRRFDGDDDDDDESLVMRIDRARWSSRPAQRGPGGRVSPAVRDR